MNALACLLLGFAVLVDIGNAAALRIHLRHARQGVGRHVSYIPLLAQLAAVGAGWASAHATSPWLPAWVFWIAGLADVALITLAYAMLRRAWHRLARRSPRG